MPVPPKLESVAKKRVLLRDVVRDQLRDAIMNGTFVPGEVLHDAELVEWLEVSRTPLRDALNELARDGLVEMSPNRYTRVVVPEKSEIVDAMRVLGVLRAGSVRFALPHFTAADTARVVELCDGVLDAVEVHDIAAMRELLFPMFTVFASRVDNQIYRDRVESTYDGYIFLSRAEGASDLVAKADIPVLMEACRSFREAVMDGDVEVARQAVEAMHFGWMDQR